MPGLCLLLRCRGGSTGADARGVERCGAADAGIDPEVGLRVHDLRHTGAYLTSQGASLRDVMARMGHASTRAALIYQHADRDRERNIAAGLSRAITDALADANGHVAGTEAPGAPAQAPERDEPRTR